MQLELQRTHVNHLFRKVKYVLHLNLVCTPDEVAIIHRHRLHETVLYEVPEIETYRTQATRALMASDARSCFNPHGAKDMMSDLASSAYYTIAAWSSYSLTVADLLAGTTVTCLSLFEQLECEEIITSQLDDLDQTVQDALAFDVGREQILEPDDQTDQAGVPPHRWARPYAVGVE